MAGDTALHLSWSALDGIGASGLCKTLTLRVRNEKSVPAQWRYRGLVDKGDKAQRDALRCFTIEPRQSIVEPGRRVPAMATRLLNNPLRKYRLCLAGPTGAVKAAGFMSLKGVTVLPLQENGLT